MKEAQVRISWKEGLHLRTATQLVRRAQHFQSSIHLKVGERIADARSILAMLLLGASLGTVVDLQVHGEDEDVALASLVAVFDPEENPLRSRG